MHVVYVQAQEPGIKPILSPVSCSGILVPAEICMSVLFKHTCVACDLSSAPVVTYRLSQQGDGLLCLLENS